MCRALFINIFFVEAVFFLGGSTPSLFFMALMGIEPIQVLCESEGECLCHFHGYNVEVDEWLLVIIFPTYGESPLGNKAISQGKQNWKGRKDIL